MDTPNTMARNGLQGRTKLVLKMKVKKTRDAEYAEYKGTLRMGNKNIVISISCDSAGLIKKYEGKDGQILLYGNAALFDANDNNGFGGGGYRQGGGNRSNSFT